jgi:hypothetical protein
MSAEVMVMASARKKVPVTPVMRQGAADGPGLVLSCVAVNDDVFDDDDRIVDHQADGGSQTPQRHEVEGLAEELEH